MKLSEAELERVYTNLLHKKESLRVGITNVEERLHRYKEILRIKTAKLKEINGRCDKLERVLYPDRKLSQIRAQRFQKLAKRVLPARLYLDIERESLNKEYINE